MYTRMYSLSRQVCQLVASCPQAMSNIEYASVAVMLGESPLFAQGPCVAHQTFVVIALVTHRDLRMVL
jgi:hypothetical protein